MSPRILEQLDPEQRAAAVCLDGPLCIIAGAGTGKTRTVTHRLAYGLASGAIGPGTALAVTHSRKAAAELADRLDRLGARGAECRTFHAAGLRVAQQFWSCTGRPGAAPVVLPEAEGWRMWRDAVRAAVGRDPDTAATRDVIEEVSWAWSRLVRVDDYGTAATFADRSPGVRSDVVVRAWRRYEDAKERVGRVDFADLLDVAAWLLETVEEAAESVRARWANVTVDEYQDTDPAQQRLLDAILGGRDQLCVVGDPRQAIYSWKGADPTYLTRFTTRYPGATVVELVRNYRSTPEIIDSACRLAATGLKPLQPTRPSGAKPHVTDLPDEFGEARWVASAIRRLAKAGTPLSEVAVLYRFNVTQARFEAACSRAGIATVVAEDSTFFEREEVRDVLVPFGRAARLDPDRLGLDVFDRVLNQRGFDPDTPPVGFGAARARWESLLALRDLVEAVPDSPSAGDLLAEINRLAVRSFGPAAAGVTLATMHRAKGLEWDVVFVVGATDGAVPSVYATTPSEQAEEERLLYVAMTRARRELHLTWAQANARGWANKPSPYIDVIEASEPRPPRFKTRSDRPRRETGGQIGAEPGGQIGAGTGGRTGRQTGTRIGAGTGGRTRAGTGRQTGTRTGEERSRGRRGTAAAGDGGVKPDVECPHCLEPLKGLAARHVGMCGRCVLTAPGPIGRRAQELIGIAAAAATRRGVDAEQVLSPAGLLRLLDGHPATADAVGRTPGVQMDQAAAQAVAEALNS